MSRPYLIHPFIVSIMLAGSWLCLLLPFYFQSSTSNDFETGEAILHYSKYLMMIFALGILSFLPILVISAYLILKKKSEFTLIDKLILIAAYLPGLSLTSFNLFIAIEGLANNPTLIVSAISNCSLLVYSILRLPRKTSD
ncbi:hypothetical protein IFT62_00375 [Pseudomonas lutea]|jgi:hypothetical protein|uniref:Lipoprotein n=1 Tax=Pseudomonas lutea TaxID=243924 RepID=A0ABR9A0Y1_9PSED|nr:hypothetical protein [Pseudomonas lutea]MBD8119666.1 hypothetical protein [Pseudomonas lutea]